MDSGDRNLMLELYKVVFQTRNLEISLFWQRSNYFLVLNTAVAAGFLSGKVAFHPVTFALFGVVFSVLWVAVNLGSKFWQSRWEHRLRLMEEKLGPDVSLFSATDDVIVQDVRASLGRAAPWSLTGLYNRLILTKPSVTKMMTLLSISFVFFWLIMLLRHA